MVAKVEEDCLSVEEARFLVERFGADRTWMMIRAIAQEKRWHELEMRAIRETRVSVPVKLQTSPGDVREEQVVGPDVVGILLKAAKCLADADKI